MGHLSMSKSKVLIIHGFGSSNVICRDKQTINLRSRLESLGFEVEYPCAPYRLSPDDFPFEDTNDCTSQPLYCWWHFLGGDRYNLDAFFKTFKDRADRDEVIGIIGISQGGSASNLIASHYEELFPRLKFAVGYGGFLWPTPWDLPDLSMYRKCIKVPYLTVYGVDDTDVTPQASMKVHDLVCGGDRAIVTHSKGHTFADGETEVVNEVMSWLEQYI